MTDEIDEKTIRISYRRLGHRPYGVTELAVIDPTGREGITATGFFDNEDEFVKACKLYNGRYNIYAGRNPRPRWFPRICMNYLDTKHRQRARDRDIQHITAISLDIDPVRTMGTSSTDSQHRKAIEFAMQLHNEIGGWVDDSGNGAYLWIPFATPIAIGKKGREIKGKCQLWQANMAKLYQPEKQGLRIDGCFDFSRLKKVIGTRSVKGKMHRLSRFVRIDRVTDDKVRDAILSLHIQSRKRAEISIARDHKLPQTFLDILKRSDTVQELWITPNPRNDTSQHDWMLGCELLKEGIDDPDDMASILMLNPFGKYQRDRRYEYVRITVNKLMGDMVGS